LVDFGFYPQYLQYPPHFRVQKIRPPVTLTNLGLVYWSLPNYAFIIDLLQSVKCPKKILTPVLEKNITPSLWKSTFLNIESFWDTSYTQLLWWHLFNLFISLYSIFYIFWIYWYCLTLPDPWSLPVWRAHFDINYHVKVIYKLQI